MTATAVGIASVMPWGEAFSLDAGGGIQYFEGTITDYFSPVGQSQNFLQQKRTTAISSAIVDAGVTVFPREWLRMRIHSRIPAEDIYGTSFAVTFGPHHWFL